jgi:hypothetical protein
MDVHLLTENFTNYIIPFLPYLLKGIKLAGQKTFEKMGEKGGEAIAEKAQKSWKSISKKKGDSAEKVKNAAKQLAKKPQDVDWQNMFKNGLEQLLSQDPDLAKELTSVLELQFGQQILDANNNKNAAVKQIMSGPGKQIAVIANNEDIIVSQEKQ